MENKSTLNNSLLFSSPWQRLPFFRGLPSVLVSGLLDGARVETTKNREIVLEQDKVADSFIFVVDGLFRLYRTNPKGQRVIMDIVGPGGMVGGLLMAQPEITYPITCQAMGPGQILRIPKSTYTKYWMNDPEVIKRTQNANLERMQALHNTRELQKYPLEEKIMQILTRMSSPMDTEIVVKVSKTDIADMIGACVESVIRIFSSWEKKGIIRRNSEGFEVIGKQSLSGGNSQ